PSFSSAERSSCPVRSENACISGLDPLSVAVTFNTCPARISSTAILVRRIGMGHFKPRQSNSLSTWISSFISLFPFFPPPFSSPAAPIAEAPQGRKFRDPLYRRVLLEKRGFPGRENRP